ncbi:hypothetical protein Fcan01_16167 [Folsomia candida]|uniref:Uncharacterized protein n=1 Tax=Folsomia candida TaxID=158441 RepID=A0A226DUK8_FOLCA|nr:hypothetical protein Fcan01_16167 [Folsomia candida]
MAKFSAHHFVILAQILTRSLTQTRVGGTTIDVTNNNATLDIIRDNLTDYLLAFENCTTMVFTLGKLSWGTKRPTHGPVMLLDYDDRISLVTGEVIQNKFSLVRRRIPAPHCWATFTILPEKAGLFEKNEYYTFIILPIFIYTSWPLNYFIMMTGAKQDVEIYFRRGNVLAYLRRTEVILVDVTIEDNSLLRLGYLNLYHQPTRTTGMEHSEAWYHIHCAPADCFDQLAVLGKNTSMLNKYFWTTTGMLGQNILSNVFGEIGISGMRGSRYGYQWLANLTSFHGFLSFVILQDTLVSGLVNLTPLHNIDPMQIMAFWRFAGVSFVMNNVQKFSFVSCYGIKGNSLMLAALSTPFDVTIWACISICFSIVVLILTSLLRRHISDAMLLLIGISLENSASLSVYETRFRQKRYPISGVCTLVALWTIFIGTILTNWYKTWFTMDLIVPAGYKSPWTSIMDVEGIKILMPFDLLAGNVFDRVPPVDYFCYKLFYIQILIYCDNIRKLQVNNWKTAKSLFNRLKPHFGMDDNLMQVRNATFSPKGSLSEPYDKNALLDYPIQPVEYDERDSYGVIKSLKTCEKVALMDTKENIAAITMFLNDYQAKVTYVKGDGHSFFTAVRGWVLPPVRSNYVEKRLTAFVSSGILTHLKILHNLWKPKKLLGHYANWTGSKFEAVSRLDFSSKVTTGFYVCGIGLLMCIVLLLAEIMKYKYSPKVNCWLFTNFGNAIDE